MRRPQKGLKCFWIRCDKQAYLAVNKIHINIKVRRMSVKISCKSVRKPPQNVVRGSGSVEISRSQARSPHDGYRKNSIFQRKFAKKPMGRFSITITVPSQTYNNIVLYPAVHFYNIFRITIYLLYIDKWESNHK